MYNDDSNTPINYHDDSRVLRYLLHNVKGISAVSGGVLGEALEREYEASEEVSEASDELDFESDI